MPTAASRVASHALRVFPRAQFSRLVGWASDIEGPTPLVQAAVRVFTTVFRVDLQEVEAPPGGWRTFDAFFTRRLQAGARPFPGPEDPTALPSPADGRVTAVGDVAPDATVEVKGQTYRLAELLARDGDGDPPPPAAGSFVVIYLAPPDYHRVHAAIGGTVSRVHHQAGDQFPVNPLGEWLVPEIFVRNERLVVEQGDGNATVMVGALGVRRIELAFAGGDPQRASGHRLAVGDELGVFHLGSSVVLILGERVRFQVAPGDVVRAGQVLGRRVGPRRLDPDERPSETGGGPMPPEGPA
jgi:phosphatidylserine decarboxylase